MVGLRSAVSRLGRKSQTLVPSIIVGISAHASASDVEKGKKAGTNDFKSKPVTMKHLQELEK
jgi:CheY-like chemotaxis protein